MNGTLGRAEFAVTAAPVATSDRLALLASYTTDGSIRPHVEYYCSRLRSNGFRVVLIIACDHPDTALQGSSHETCADFVLLRDNLGFDFGSWSHAFDLMPECYNAACCLLTNDSIFGPFRSFDQVIGRCLSFERQADLIGLTDSHEVMYHLQSYFLYVSARLLAADCFRQFIGSVRPFTEKSQVINLYELPLARFVSMSGYRAGALFSAASLQLTDNRNITLCHWRKLIQQGFPFIKAELLRDNPCATDINDWESVVSAAGYDAGYIRAGLASR